MKPERRLTELRAALKRRDLTGLLVPRADEHLNEYIPASADRLRWLTGFTGSAGLAIVLSERAAIFTDGRYQLQVRAEVDAARYAIRHSIEEPAEAWLAEALRPGDRLGFDPWLHAEEALAKLRRAVEAAGAALVPVEPNPVDEVWTGRPGPPAGQVAPHPAVFSGEESSAKRVRIGEAVAKAGAAAAVLTAPESIAWLLNIRGDDVPYNPVALAFAILRADGQVSLFLDPARIDPATRAQLGNGVAIEPRAALAPALDRLAAAREAVLVDPRTAPVWFAGRLRAAGARVLAEPDPVALPKATKNTVEQAGARAAHRRDAVAVCRFLAWLDREGPTGQYTEIEAAERLLALRAEGERFRGESFPAISGSGPNGAIIHYRATAATNRRIVSGDLYLSDSGAQYLDGTTDVTRTVPIGDAPADVQEIRDRFTRVLKGHIAIATLRWPRGVAGPHVETMARRALWDVGLDYDHGTGHGVGSYLSVHEGPTGLSRAARPIPLAPGMILSNEPGFYAPGRWGIRLENLLLVVEAPFEGAAKPFLGFETLTLAPFDRRLIDPALLSPAERSWLDTYHARVVHEVGPLLDPAERMWLAAACRPL
ncbi:aminopeptidase P family protein [Elioraea sp.]|uniref:aminopeptidase P family protein n=1 Tax=Elioraea sp. TaxID=2185103 RepID=UPI003F6FABFA